MSIADSIAQFDHALTAGELARLLGVHKVSIYRWAEAGTIPHFRINSCLRFDPGTTAKWLRERGVL